MRFACKALFFALLADVAPLCMTASNNLSVEKKAAMGRIMESIGELLQTHSHVDVKVLNNLRALASVTPGVSETTNDIFRDVIVQIEQSVESKIITGHANTQTAIDNVMTAVEATSDEAMRKKSVADDADTAWFMCIRTERSKLADYEDATAAEASSRSSSTEPCQTQQDERPFEGRVVLPQFHCDISGTGNCKSQLADYKTAVAGLLSALQNNMATENEKYTVAAKACTEAMDDVAQKQSAMEEELSLFNAQRDACLTMHETRMMGMCSFGEDLQRKCEKVSEYKALIASTDQVDGDEHSQPDREQEWLTTSKVKCMLSNVINGIEINDASLGQCVSEVNYVRDVGDLDRKDSEFKVQTTIDRFTCQESAITFRGEMWETPSGPSPESSGYKIMPFTPEVDLSPGGDPFAFCGVAANPVGKR